MTIRQIPSLFPGKCNRYLHIFHQIKWPRNGGHYFLQYGSLFSVSRIVMKVHFPTDILAGFALGAAYSLILFKLYKFLGSRCFDFQGALF
ncbi:phosphatase PAP2 family protein [Peribacillus frigoritolerans]|uniref:phosphatase PAP2 family protein n=1 Tax=Peribacillus frigoritolerans TaxID=450367 RepID=UPI0038235D36